LVVTYPDGVDFPSDEIALTSDRVVDIRRTPPRPPAPNPLIYLGLGTIIGLGSLAGLFLLGGEGVRLAILLVPLLLYTRLKRDKVLDHFLRGRIFEVIRKKPGITYNAIRRDLGISNGSLAYHVYTLQREGFVKSVPEGPYRRFFTMDEPVSRAGVLVSELQKKILDLLAVEPGISQSIIANRLGTSPQSVNYNVSRLVRKGMVRLEGWGWKKQCFASAAGVQT
jgi:DNA-binding MarR family transcriptional regulator